MLDIINDAWSWIGLDATDLIASNLFGNVIVRDRHGRFWRICPEELTCEVIAANDQEYSKLWTDDEFQTDWTMGVFLEQAVAKFGPLPPDRCYCLKLPAVLGGEYSTENLGTISRNELISFAGDIAEQIKDVPEGGKVELIVGNPPPRKRSPN
jgi:hypothetical protein